MLPRAPQWRSNVAALACMPLLPILKLHVCRAGAPLQGKHMRK